jgi:NitT/TauT family transport system permease protein
MISLVDVFLFFGVILFIYAILGVTHEWVQPYHPKTEIQLGFNSLLRYSFFSLIRVFAAYLLSLLFTFTYGYVAAKSRRLEPILISLLDILQSIPVLGFMPGFVLALVRLFPESNLGLELAAILMIFTGEGWNLVFSFYSSVRGVPQDVRDMTSIFKLSKWRLLRMVEIPFAMNGLLWNSMLSMAGGWFFLMVIESFTLGDQDFRLPGIGSYMAVAYDKHDYTAVGLGIFVMFSLIFIVDRVLWAPLVVWSEKFQSEKQPTKSKVGTGSLVLDLLEKSRIIEKYFEWKQQFQKNWEQKLDKSKFPKRIMKKISKVGGAPPVLSKALRGILAIIGVVFLFWAGQKMYSIIAVTKMTDWWLQLKLTFFTFLRVTVAVILGSLWTIPAGVFIGTHPKWTRRLQPMVQIVASFPAPMVFPMLTLVMIKMGVNFEWGSIVLMLFASQWYILFNVISGATLIPRDFIDLGQLFRLSGIQQWKAIVIPSVFPSLVNGWITAAGGAWNASIVAELVEQGGQRLVATGVGASITEAARVGNFSALATGIVVMITIVVLLNRLLWGSLYKLAETRYRLE